MAAINFPRHVCIRYTFMDNSFCKNFVHLYINVYIGWAFITREFYYVYCCKMSRMTKMIFIQPILHKGKKLYRQSFNIIILFERVEERLMYQIEDTTVDLSQPCHDNIADKGIAAKSKRSLAYSIPKSQTTREGDGRLEDDPWSTSSRLQEKWRRVRAGEIGGAGEAETRRKTCQFVGCWSYVSATRRKYAPLPFLDATLAEGGGEIFADNREKAR